MLQDLPIQLESLQDHSRPPGTESALIAPASEFTFGISFETALDGLRNQTKKTCVSYVHTYHIYIHIIYTYIYTVYIYK